MLEAAVAARRPDLPRGRDATGIGRAGRPLMEPPDLWAPFEPRTESGPPKRGAPCDRLGDVVGAVYRRAAGKPVQRVRAVLERELQAADIRVTSAYADELVASLVTADRGPFKRLLAPARWRRRPREQAGREPEPLRSQPRMRSGSSDEPGQPTARVCLQCASSHRTIA